jgi:hypothetical protein
VDKVTILGEITKRKRGTGEQTEYFRREGGKNRKVGKIGRKWRENG